MFSAQAGQIANALRSAGLSPDAAQQIAAILGNGVQNLVRTNPETVDLTPPAMRYVTPERRTYQLPGLDFRQGDPDYRPQQVPDGERRVVPQQASTVRREPAPQQTQATYRVRGGAFTEAKGVGDAVQVGLRVAGNGNVALLDPSSNTIIGKTVRCEADDSGLRFFAEETGTEIVFRLMIGEYLSQVLGGVTDVEVVTGVRLENGSLAVYCTPIRAFVAGEQSLCASIPTVECSGT